VATHTLHRDSGKELMLTEEERYDPFALYNAIERAPSQLHHYWETLIKSQRVLKDLRKEALELESLVKVWCHEEIQNGRPAGSSRTPTQNEIQIHFNNLTSQEQLPANLTDPNVIAAVEKYKKVDAEVTEWATKVAELEVVVESWRIRCSMLRSQAQLMQGFLQQNMISIPKAEAITFSSDRLGPDDVGGDL
jgi:hypothetical protein